VPLAIRPLSLADVESAVSLIRFVWREFFGTHSDESVRTYLDEPGAFEDVTSGAYSQPRNLFLVAVDEDHVVATGAVWHVDATSCELRRMFVHPNYRRRGLARQIAVELLEFAARADYEVVRLETNRTLSASHRLYESLGFAYAQPFQGVGEDDVYYMERPIQGVTARATNSGA
jgi:putative acetyltransferase